MRNKSLNNDKFNELAKLWLQKAGEDLKWAKASFEDGFFAGACFISQQVAEKSLKAYLFSQRQKLIRTHILPRLLKNCLKFDKTFETLKEACEILTLYYTEARYPDDVDTSSFNTKPRTKQAISLAQDVLAVVDRKISY